MKVEVFDETAVFRFFVVEVITMRYEHHTGPILRQFEADITSMNYIKSITGQR
jgi:hypothetical protein